MATTLQNLSEIFNKCLFRIPDYQRGYAWESSQRNDFWNDLARATKSGANHYCGQLTLELVAEPEWSKWTDEAAFIRVAKYKPFAVVDGQQRLTTAIILLQALLEDLPDDQQLAGENVSVHRAQFLVKPSGNLKHGLFGYSHDNPSHLYFRTQILRAPSNEFSGVHTLYTTNLRNALDEFRARVSSAPNEQKEAWFSALTQRFMFNVYELSTDFDVFVAFETMNNRGKPLTRLELLKNRLIYLTTLWGQGDRAAESEQVRRNINSVWRTIYEELGRNPDDPLDDDDFLRAHLILYFPEQSGGDPLSSFLLGKHFHPDRLDDGALSLADIQSYIDSLQLAARRWRELNFPAGGNTLPESIAAALLRLKRLGFGVFRPLLLAMLMRVESATDQIGVATQAERFLLLVRSFAKTRANVAENESHRLARELHAGDITAKIVADVLSGRVQRHFTLAAFQVQIDDLFESNGGGFYRLSGLHYVLFEYEEELRRSAKSTTGKISWDEFAGDWDSIEHIYPQDATDQDWPEFAQFSEEQKQYLAHSLGNLVAISHAKNASLKRAAFAIKVNGNGSGKSFRLGSFSENKIALSVDESLKPLWTAKQIYDRGLALLKFIETRWDVSLGDEASKSKLLKADVWAPPPVIQS